MNYRAGTQEQREKKESDFTRVLEVRDGSSEHGCRSVSAYLSEKKGAGELVDEGTRSGTIRSSQCSNFASSPACEFSWGQPPRAPTG